MPRILLVPARPAFINYKLKTRQALELIDNAPDDKLSPAAKAMFKATLYERNFLNAGQLLDMARRFYPKTSLGLTGSTLREDFDAARRDLAKLDAGPQTAGRFYAANVKDALHFRFLHG